MCQFKFWAGLEQFLFTGLIWTGWEPLFVKVSPKVQPRVGDKRFDDRLITTIVSAIPFVHWDDVSSLLMFSWVSAAAESEMTTGMKEPKQIDWIGSCQPPLQMICNMSSIFCQLIWSNSNKKVILLHFNIVDEIGSTRSTGAWPKSMWDPNKILTSVWRLKCIWGPLAFSIYRL